MVVNVGDAGKPSTIAIAANYQDMLARTPGGWRIKRRAAAERIPPMRP